MSGTVDLFGVETPEPPVPPRVTERDVLDALRRRFTHRGGNGERYVLAEHVRDHGAWASRTADLIVRDLWESAGVALHGFEVKVSRADWLAELRDPTKADRFRRHCDYWWLAVHDASIVHDDLPDGWGLIVMSGNTMRARVQAPRLTPEPMDPIMRASLDRSIAKTARRHLVLDAEAGRAQECERFRNTTCLARDELRPCWSCRATRTYATRDQP